jgi:hypothetical protein
MKICNEINAPKRLEVAEVKVGGQSYTDTPERLEQCFD